MFKTYIPDIQSLYVCLLLREASDTRRPNIPDTHCANLEMVLKVFVLVKHFTLARVWKDRDT